MKEHTDTRAVREHRNYLLVLWGVGVSRLAHYLFSFAMGLYILKQTGSAQSFAMTICISLLPTALLSPVVGTLADRVSKKVLIVGADFLNALVMFGVFAYALNAPISVGTAYLATFLLAVLDPFVGITFTSAIPRLVEEATAPKLVSMKSAVDSVIQIAAPIIGGAVYAIIDMRIFVLIAGVSFFLSGISELFIDYRFRPIVQEEQAEKPCESMLTSMANGARYLFSKSYLVAAAAVALVINFLFSGFNVLFPYAMLHTLGLSEASYGVVMGAIPVGTLLGALYLSKRNQRLTRTLIARVVLGFAVTCVLLALPLMLGMRGELLISAFYCVVTLSIGLLCAMINITASVFFQSVVPGELLGRVSGLFSMVAMLVMPVGVLMFGTLADQIRPAYLFAASGVGMLITAVAAGRARALDSAYEPCDAGTTGEAAA